MQLGPPLEADIILSSKLDDCLLGMAATFFFFLRGFPLHKKPVRRRGPRGRLVRRPRTSLLRGRGTLHRTNSPRSYASRLTL